jgi:hypothetical protein
LELVLVEQEVHAKHNIERTLRPVRHSSSRERTPPDTVKAQKKARPLTFHPDTLARSLDFQKKVDNGTKDTAAVVNTLESKRKSAPFLSQTSVKVQPSPPNPRLTAKGGKPGSDQSTVSQGLPSPQLKSSPNEKAAKPASQQHEAASLGKPMSRGKQNGIATATQPKNERFRPKSLGPYVPQHAAEQLIRNATPNAMKRETVHILSLPVLDLFSGTKRTTSVEASPLPSPLPFLLPLSSLGASFSDSIQPQQHVSTKKTSIDSDCSILKHNDSVSSAGYPSTTPSSVPPSSPPTMSTSTRGPDKRKSWNPRSIVAARKAKQETDERRMDRNNFQDTTAMAKASQKDNTKGTTVTGSNELVARPGTTARPDLERRKTTAFEGFAASHSTPDLLSTGILPDCVPVPTLGVPGEQRRSDWVQADEDDAEQKEGLWRRLRRRTLNGGQQPEPEEIRSIGLQAKPSSEHLRWKQLAMRERAISDAKKPKENKVTTVLPQSTLSKMSALEVNLQQLQDLQQRERKNQQSLVEDIHVQLVKEKNVEQKELEKAGEQKEPKKQSEQKEHEKQTGQKEPEKQSEQEPEKVGEQREPEKQSEQPKPKKVVDLSSIRRPSLLIGTKPPTAPPKGAIPDIPRTPARSRKTSGTSHTMGFLPSAKEATNSPLPSTLTINPLPPSPPLKDEKIVSSLEEAPRSFSPFTSPRPPPRIDSLQRKASSPTILQTQPPSTVVTARMNTSRAPSRDIYSTPIMSKTPSIRSRPLVTPDGQPYFKTTSAISINRPKTSGAAPIIPQGIPEFTYFDTQRNAYSQDLQNLRRGTTSPSSPEPPAKNSKHRPISRFYSSPAVPTTKPINLEDVEKIPGMTPQSVLFLREQEKLAAEKYGRNFSLPITGVPPLRRALTEGPPVGGGGETASEGGRSKKWKKHNWWKVWRLS